MPLDLSCTCGERFTVPDDLSGPVVCPRSGQAVIAVRPEAAEEEIGFQEPAANVEKSTRDMPRRPRARRRALLPTHLLGYKMRARNWVALGLLALPLLGVLWLLLPSPLSRHPCADRQRLRRRSRSRTRSSALRPTPARRRSVVVVRPMRKAMRCCSSQALRAVPQPAPIRAGTIYLRNADFVLNRNGESVEALLVEENSATARLAYAYADGASRWSFVPTDRPPWTVAGTTENRCQPEFVKDEDGARPRADWPASWARPASRGRAGPTSAMII